MADRWRDWRPRRRDLIVGGAGFGAAALGAGLWHFAAGREDELEVLPPGERLIVLSDRDASFGAQREVLVGQWNSLHPEQRAEMRSLPASADLTYSAIHARLQARDRGVDVVNLDIPWIAEFAGQGHLRELEDLADDGFLEAPFEAGRVDGKVYALPFNTDVGLLYYRKDLVRVDDSWTEWEEYVQRAQALMSDDRTREKAPELEAGIAMQLGPYEGFTVNVWEVLLSRGAEPVREDLIQIAEDRTSITALSRLGGLLRNGTILRESLEFDEAQSLEAFMAGRTAFLRHWPNAYFQLLACEAVDFQVGVAPLPGVGVLGGQSLAVTSYSRYPVAARRLAEFLTSARSQQILFERGGFAATRPEPYRDVHLRTGDATMGADQAVPDACLTPEAPQGFPASGARALDTALRDAGRRPALDRYNRFSAVFRDRVHRAFSEGDDVDPELLQEELEAAVEGR